VILDGAGDRFSDLGKSRVRRDGTFWRGGCVPVWGQRGRKRRSDRGRGRRRSLQVLGERGRDQAKRRRADCGWELAWLRMAMLACCRIEFLVSCAVS
jgi:hypothetical protein